MRSEIHSMIQPRTVARALQATLFIWPLLAGRVSLGDPPKPSDRSVSVAALEMHRQLGGKLSEGLGLKEEGATNMTFVLCVPDRNLFALDPADAALIAFTDDKGTNLLAARPGRLGKPGLQQYAAISSDNHRAKVELQSLLAPAEGATKLVLKGTIPALCGADRKKVRQDQLSLLEGTKFKLASLELEVAKVETRSYDDGSAMTVQFKSNASLRPIKSVRFLSSSGKEIKSLPIGRGSFRNNKSILETCGFALWENVASVTVEADMFTQTETVQIPVSLEIGVGLGSAASPAK